MKRSSGRFRSILGEEKLPRSSAVALLLGAGILSTTASASFADESGVSFWLPRTFGSLAAVPSTPGWAVASVYYHTSVSAGADVAAAREIQIGRFSPTLNANLNANLSLQRGSRVEVPPLRDRREDIPMLTWTLVREFCNSMGKRIDEIADESMAALQEYRWPGNVRELRNVLERAMILEHGPKLHIKLRHATLLPIAVTATAGSLEKAERAIILQAAEQCNWRIRGPNGAAALLDIKPTTLESRIKKLGLAPRRWPPNFRRFSEVS
jgi:hypothetical protein